MEYGWLPNLSAPLLPISRKLIIHVILIIANNRHLLEDSVSLINQHRHQYYHFLLNDLTRHSQLVFKCRFTILLSVKTHTKALINWKMIMELSKTPCTSKKIQHISITFKNEEFTKIYKIMEMVLHKELDKSKFTCLEYLV